MKAQRFLLPGILVALSVASALAEPPGTHWLCHRTNGNNPWRLISVSETAVDMHTGHGDLYAGDASVLSEPLYGWACEVAP